MLEKKLISIFLKMEKLIDNDEKKPKTKKK